MPDLVIEFSSEVELEGARSYAAELERSIGRMKAMGQDASELTSKLTSLNSAIEQSSQKLTTMGGVSAEVRDALQAQARDANEAAHAQDEHGKTMVATSARALGFAAALAGVASGLAAVKKGLEEFGESEEVITALDAALAVHGNLVDSTRRQYQELAAQLEETTAIADEEWLKVLATLTKFGAQPGEIDKVAEAVKNLAGFMGGDLNSAAVIVGKALQGKFETLSRYGIKVDETKSKTEQLESVFQQLAQRGGGQLEARANTLRGQMDALKIASSNFFEGLGNAASRTGVVQFAIEHLTKATNHLNRIFPQFVEQNEKLKNGAAGAAQEIIAEAEAQERLRQATASATAELERRNRAIERQAGVNRGTLGSEFEGRLAQVDIDEAAGRISPEQANVRRANIRDIAQSSQLQTERLSLLGQQKNLRDALAQPGLTDANRNSLQDQLGDVEGRLAVNFGQLKTAQQTGRAGIAQAEAGARSAEAKRLEQQIKDETASMGRVMGALKDNSEAQREFLRTIVDDNVKLRDELKQLRQIITNRR
jgi:uncharacterized protein YdbL (DUF1318 family)